jgi:predicted DNA-binding protein (UPF0251 family)
LKGGFVPRPRKERLILLPPLYTSFKPAGVRRRGLKTISLSLDEYEALRLADLLHFEHSEAAEKMQISRPTFTRLVTLAREKTTRFLIEGLHLCIEGGSIHFSKNVFKCEECGKEYNTSINSKLTKCPECGSDRITDLARNMGHGECCRSFTKETNDKK